MNRRVETLLLLLGLWFGGVPALAGSVVRVEPHVDHVVLMFDARLIPPGMRANVRLALDTAAPGVDLRTEPGGVAPSLTIAVQTADDVRFARAAAEGRLIDLPPFSYGRPVARPVYRVSQLLPSLPPAPALPRIYGDDPRRPLVVIDPGHGGFDPGAVSASGLREKDVTLKIALAIRDRMLAGGRVRVALTREDDRFLVLQERYGIARRLKADLFISVHCDSVGESASEAAATGATIYTLSEVASDKEAARLAARENRADAIAGLGEGEDEPDLSALLLDLTQRETMEQSARFANLLGREAGAEVPLKPNFHRMASLIVLKAPDVPSILFETGYISNPRDAAFIASAQGQQAIAQALARAVDIYFARRLSGR